MSEAAAGAIHDIGYQRYTGVRLGRPYAVRSLYTHGVRTAFGMGRSAKAKIFPWLCVGVLMLIAVIDVAIRSQTGRLQISYVALIEDGMLLILLFLASAAPELVSRDLRAKVLPLYFSRPIRRTDYALAKYAALATAVWAILAAPMLVIFLGGAFSLDGAGRIWREFTDFLGGLVAAGILAIVFSAIALLIASLISRRMVAAAVIVALFLVTSTVSFAVGQMVGGDGVRYGNLLSPQSVVEPLSQWLFLGDPKDYGGFGFVYLIAAAAYAGVAGLLVLVRYRRVSA